MTCTKSKDSSELQSRLFNDSLLFLVVRYLVLILLILVFTKFYSSFNFYWFVFFFPLTLRVCFWFFLCTCLAFSLNIFFFVSTEEEWEFFQYFRLTLKNSIFLSFLLYYGKPMWLPYESLPYLVLINKCTNIIF